MQHLFEGMVTDPMLIYQMPRMTEQWAEEQKVPRYSDRHHSRMALSGIIKKERRFEKIIIASICFSAYNNSSVNKFTMGWSKDPGPTYLAGRLLAVFFRGIMKKLSVFVDESGDFGEYEKHAPYYIMTMGSMN